MKQSTKDKLEGKLHEVKGKVKEKVGQVTNNPDTETEGQSEKIAGKVQEKVGPNRKGVREVIDRPRARFLLRTRPSCYPRQRRKSLAASRTRRLIDGLLPFAKREHSRFRSV
jgi:uncharacterized protein YjbJ (UPF0337 family)